ncbi:lytic transglycosylase domain-containing protein [Vibrio sp. 1CM23M]|uniref:lytic transglycosylase domain-containing protein n=1 Tax=Vibrio sp. 1CM23M TaxID=2929164 RepID=UPI0020BD4CCD|nr:lytic transglycosylase domain-containing protein [Vibrio sp. 1CM23M]MCK8070484.1 lytic transglycosylase domain-containing protein [Vibrio sp. 1CM23M]
MAKGFGFQLLVHWFLGLVLLIMCFQSSSSYAQNRPSQNVIQPHINTLKPYQNQILKKLEEFDPLVNEIFRQLAERSLPDSFVFVPMLESSYNSNAISPAKAAGLWQLMPATAERFGLTVNDRQDQRFEIEPSTHAAMQYLDFLYRKFDGDINLTLAAYNAGEGRVQRAVKKAGSRQFSDLRLPKETVDYVHRFYALLVLVDVTSLKQNTVAPMWLFASESHWQSTPLVNLTPLPPLISL